jgi:hypothetical protein
MRFREFKYIYDNLNRPGDIKHLAKDLGLEEEMLNVIYTQKTVRDTKKSFHRVKRVAPKMLKEWKGGRSIMDISDRYNFPPMLTGLFIFQERGFSKKQFWKNVREPETIRDERTRKEIEEIAAADHVYSPWASDIQYKRGAWGEALLEDWLDGQGITYRTEKDLRGEFPKTPDCLLDEPIELNGWKLHWIESKATFGDHIEVKYNVKNQLVPYTELFGTGMVIYWFGFLDTIETPEGVEISDMSVLNMKCNK